MPKTSPSTGNGGNSAERRQGVAEITLRVGCQWRLGKAWGPEPNRYQAFARFEEDHDRSHTWTLLLRLSDPLDRGSPRLAATVHYLMPEAPQHLILPGARFILHPGHESDAFADGVVVEAAVH